MTTFTTSQCVIPVFVSAFVMLMTFFLPVQTLNINLLIISCAAMVYLFLIVKLDNLMPTNDSHHSAALLANLTNMINRLEYRDNILIKEKEDAEAANRAKSTFLASMSHELRTPMHAILNFADLGKENCISHHYDEKTRTYFQRIEESGERLLKLINGLLDLTRLESGKTNFKFESNSINECIKSVCNEITPLLDRKSIKVQLYNADTIDFFTFDKDRIIMVLINLLSNAIKFSPTHSVISIILERGEYNFPDNTKKNGIKISVEDQGIGIEDREREAIFNKFIQGSRNNHTEGGSGIGLAICREIINAHGGNIWAEGNKGAGSRISFTIAV